MLFVIGGAYQGKLDYVKERFGIDDSEIFTCTEDSAPDFSKRVIYHYEKYVMYAVRNGEEPFCGFADNQIVIMDDLNCGVVPVDAGIRAYREAAGRAGCALTRRADEVVRIFCGLPKMLKSKTVRIYLIRHGETQAAADHCYCGSTDMPLTDSGREALAAKKAAGVYPAAGGMKIYSSGLVRARETAEIIFPGADIEEVPDFNEMDFGDFELRKYDSDLQSDPDFIIWTGGNNETNVCPHGESSLIMKRRVLAAFEDVLAKGENCAIVSHGGPVEAIFSKYNPDSGLNYYEIQPKHGEGYCLEFEGSRLIGCSKVISHR